MIISILPFIGSAVGMANQWASSIYNSPKNQVKRLEKAGFSKNAFLMGASNSGNASQPTYVNPVLESAEYLQKGAQIKETETKTELTKQEVDWGKKKYIRLTYDASGMPVETYSGKTNYEALRESGLDMAEDNARITAAKRSWEEEIGTAENIRLRFKGLKAILKREGIVTINAENEKKALDVLIKSAGTNISFWEAVGIMIAQQGITKVR